MTESNLIKPKIEHTMAPLPEAKNPKNEQNTSAKENNSVSSGSSYSDADNNFSFCFSLLAALDAMISYTNSQFSLQASDTRLEEMISNNEAQVVQQQESALTAAGDSNLPLNLSGTNFIWQMEHLTKDNDKATKDNPHPDYSTDMTKLSNAYNAANMQNQSIIKIMDGNNSTAQNTLNAIAQAQPQTIQAMSSLTQVEANLARALAS